MDSGRAPMYRGAEVSDFNEARFARRLRSDLARRRVPAIIFANFLTAATQERQVDFLVWTPHRLVHVELKTFQRHAPVIAPLNGEWTQMLRGHLPRTVGNGGRQALDTTYAISDVLRQAAAHLGLSLAQPAYKFIDTVVCMNPVIPPGSAIDDRQHVAFCGYTDLLDRLGEPAARQLGWTDVDIAAVAEYLNLGAEPEDPAAATRQAADLDELVRYRSAFVDGFSCDLHELVPIPMVDTSDNDIAAPTILNEAIDSDETVTVVGPSGSGKSHAVRHTVLDRAREDAVPIWVSCRDYDEETFANAMAKAAARFTTLAWADLFQRARRQALAPVIVLDGLNECSPEQQRILTEGAQAYRNVNPCAVITTSPHPTGPSPTHLLHTREPNEHERSALVASYGPGIGLIDTPAFRSAWEITMATECASVLPEEATPVDLFDLYCRQLSESEVQRNQLRALAVTMRTSLRQSLHLNQIRSAVLTRSGRTITADEIDRLLANKLLDVGPQRFSFRHESLITFLAAQHLVLTSSSGEELADHLREPALSDLCDLAIRLEVDDCRREAALLALSRPDLLARSAQGEFGPTTELRILRALREKLRSAATISDNATFHFTGEPERPAPFSGHWERPPIRPVDIALLEASGRCLAAGRLIAEVAELLDSTDEHCWGAMQGLQQQRVPHWISTVVEATYSSAISTRTVKPSAKGLEVGDLPATIVLRAAYLNRFTHESTRSEALALRMRDATAAQPRWGRLAAALTILNVDSEADLQCLPGLVGQAWACAGYHLRLDALYAAQLGARWMNDTNRTRLRDVLESIDVGDNWALSSVLVEALAACGAIEPIATLEALEEEAAHIVAHREDPNAAALALSLIGRQFEDEGIFGPVSEMVSELAPAQLVALCGLALSAEDAVFSFARGWAVTQLAEHVEVIGPDERRVLEGIVTTPPAESFGAQEGIQAHLEALRAWAKMAEPLPLRHVFRENPIAEAWGLIDELVFSIYRSVNAFPKDPTAAPRSDSADDETWRDLWPLRAVATDAFLQMASAGGWTPRSPTLYELVSAKHEDQLRAIYEWALNNWGEVRPAVGSFLHTTRDALLRELGRVGNARTQSVLQSYLDDPELAPSVVAAIRSIEGRLAER